jgi:hypothetical protein
MRSVCVAASIALCVALFSAAARPQGAEIDSPERARAVELGRQGIALYNKRRWVEAYEVFERAEALIHSPVFLLYMARAKRQTRELVASRSLYQRIVDQPGGSEPEPWRQARSDAAAELEALRPRIPALRIVVASAGPAKVWLDGAPLAPERIGQPIEVDPGPHEAVARMASGDVVRQRITVREAQRNVRIELAWPPRKPVIAPASEPARRAPAPGGAGDAQRTGGLVLIVLGSGVTIAGIATGALALAKANDLEQIDADERESSDIETHDALRYTAITTLVVGGATLVTGIVVYATAPTAPEVSLGPGFIGLKGRF